MRANLELSYHLMHGDGTVVTAVAYDHGRIFDEDAVGQGRVRGQLDDLETGITQSVLVSSVLDKGTVNVQGKNQPQACQLLGVSDGSHAHRQL